MWGENSRQLRLTVAKKAGRLCEAIEGNIFMDGHKYSVMPKKCSPSPLKCHHSQLCSPEIDNLNWRRSQRRISVIYVRSRSGEAVDFTEQSNVNFNCQTQIFCNAWIDLSLTFKMPSSKALSVSYEAACWLCLPQTCACAVALGRLGFWVTANVLLNFLYLGLGVSQNFILLLLCVISSQNQKLLAVDDDS